MTLAGNIRVGPSASGSIEKYFARHKQTANGANGKRLNLAMTSWAFNVMLTNNTMICETAFTMDASGIKFGSGATRELGYDMQLLGVKRAMLVTDPNLATSQPVAVALAALRASGIDTALFDRVRVEPTDASLKEAIRFATESHFDGYVAVGGGSSEHHYGRLLRTNTDLFLY